MQYRYSLESHKQEAFVYRFHKVCFSIQISEVNLSAFAYRGPCSDLSALIRINCPPQKNNKKKEFSHLLIIGNHQWFDSFFQLLNFRVCKIEEDRLNTIFVLYPAQKLPETTKNYQGFTHRYKLENHRNIIKGKTNYYYDVNITKKGNLLKSTPLYHA